MTPSAFRLTEREIDDQIREIAVEGELDLAVGDQLDRLLAGATARWVLVDLAGCEFLDSACIAVILRADQAARERDGRVLVHSPQAQVRRVLDVTGLAELELVCADRAQALARAGRGDEPLTAPG